MLPVAVAVTTTQNVVMCWLNWKEALALVENFFALASDSRRFSANVGPCLVALRSHLDGMTSRLSRLGE